MRSENWFGAQSVVLTSASSKTAMGLASCAEQNSPNIKRIGLTSSGNVDFVRQTGMYDEVLSYDEVSALPQAPTVTVDFAGNASLLQSLHEHLTDNLTYSCLVGVTHIEDRGGVGLRDERGLPGAKPTLFFAPDHAVALFKQHGPQEAGAMMAKAWHGFLESVGGSVAIETRKGLEAARQTYLEMVGGKVDPAQGIVIEP